MKTPNKRIFEIARAVINEAIGFGFSLGKLREIRPFNKKVAYCKECLGQPIGNGSSRMVFQLDDRWVLKLAKNAKGLAQNEHEGTPNWYRDTYGIFPEVNYDLSDTDYYTYLVSEYVLPVKEADFQECLGITSGEFYEFLRKCAETYTRGFRSAMTDERFTELIEEHEILNEWCDCLNNFSIVPFDFRHENFGLANRDGEPAIVMLDSGVDEKILNKYYC